MKSGQRITAKSNPLVVFSSVGIKSRWNMKKLQNYINGELVSPISNQYIDNHNPATSEIYSLSSDSDERDVATAVAAAEKAFPKWSITPVEERSRLMMRVAQLIEQNRDKLALAESIDNGKPVVLAKCKMAVAKK